MRGSSAEGAQVNSALGVGQDIIVMAGVCCTVSGQSPRRVLVDVDVRVAAGEYVAVTGPSGAGKSTWLNVVGLLEPYDAGSYRLSGDDVGLLDDAARSRRRGDLFGFVFQSFHLLDDRSVLDNVAMAGLYRGRRRSDDDHDAAMALDRVRLADRAGDRPNVLSGGERQRVAVARAICGHPQVVLADEPTGNLDSASGAAVLDVFDRLVGDGFTVVVVTHDGAVADRAHRRLRMLDGRMSEAS